MIKKLIEGIIASIGGVLSVIALILLRRYGILQFENQTNYMVVGGVVFALGTALFYLLAPHIQNALNQRLKLFEKELEGVPPVDIVFGSIGLILGLIIAYLLSQPILNIQVPFLGSLFGIILAIIIYFAFGSLGLKVGIRSKDDILNLLNRSKGSTKEREKSNKKSTEHWKILDTSVLIDGRIIDIIKADFIEGTLILPIFVLEELQRIADSADNLRRQRGRRGLDILNEIQHQSNVEVLIRNETYDNIKEVDSKILKMAQEFQAKVITNDYNLNKVAEVQGIKVLNINELANAVKPVVIPGEEMTITVIKDGKESNQGLAYLDDGTMIVVEDGKRHIGKTIQIVVTSVIQTAAGKMIFAKPK